MKISKTLIAMSLGWLAMSAFATDCSAVMGPINIVGRVAPAEFSAPAVNLPSHVLHRKMLEGDYSELATSHWPKHLLVLGATSAGWNISYKLGVATGNASNGQYCARLNMIDFEAILAKIQIFLASELEGLTCSRENTYRHELEHVLEHVAMHEMIKREALDRVTRALANFPVVYGNDGAELLANARTEASARLTKMRDGWTVESKARHRPIDENYGLRAIDTACPGEGDIVTLRAEKAYAE